MSCRLDSGDSTLAVTGQCKVEGISVGHVPEEEAFDRHLLADHRGPHAIIRRREVPVLGESEIALVMCPGLDKHTGLCVLPCAFTHALVEQVQLPLDAMRHSGSWSGGGGEVEIHRIQRESCCRREVDNSVCWGSNADRWCHGGGRGRRRQEEHDGGDVDFDEGGGTMMSDK